MTRDGTAEYSAALLDQEMPGAVEDGGAVGAGGGGLGESRPVPSLFAKENCALVCHYICIGVVNGLLQNALQPYCQYVVHGAPNQCATLATFVNLPWGFKVFYGLLSDAVPICGMHRKPYLKHPVTFTVFESEFADLTNYLQWKAHRDCNGGGSTGLSIQMRTSFKTGMFTRSKRTCRILLAPARGDPRA
jgi:hypothetical protein